MEDNSKRRETDLVLAPNEFAYIQDRTKGQITCHVGPTKTSLSQTDAPVVFDDFSKKFVECQLENAIKTSIIAPEGWYAILKNPGIEGKHPRPSGSETIPQLLIGHKENIPGPISFALWPGQMAKVVQGHHLKSNQYLLVRVYDEKAARENLSNAVVKPQIKTKDEIYVLTEDDEQKIKEKWDKLTDQKKQQYYTNLGADILPADQEAKAYESFQKDESEALKLKQRNEIFTQAESEVLALEPNQITMGKLMVIKGINVSFYIPPTGIEVVKDANEKYIRDAVSLERLEYCILRDENGSKTFTRGPLVVFPKPTETFIENDGSRVFRAIELNENSGIYIKVIADYKDEDGTEHKVGDELFITGRDNDMIYFPREEHAIVKYGDQIINYAVAIPEGEARYVLDRNTGKVSLVKGPNMFLPDPRKQVIVKRILDTNLVKLLYPNNAEALHYNQTLAELAKEKDGDQFSYLENDDISSGMAKRAGSTRSTRSFDQESYSGERFERKTKYTPPRIITLNTKYEGAVTVEVYTGYAIQVVAKSGNRDVVVGPKTIMLEYDQSVEAMALSTGTPKKDDNLLHTAFLRVQNNKVSDYIKAETKDLVRVDIRLSYRVNFDGEKEKWFSVENYVKFLCDHMRSLICNLVKQYTIEEFYGNSRNILRDTILGKSTNKPVDAADVKTDTKSTRPGRQFDENGMRIYDVEVLEVEIANPAIKEMLVDAQHDIVANNILVTKKGNELKTTQEIEKLTRQIKEEQNATHAKEVDLEIKSISKNLEKTIASLEYNFKRAHTEIDNDAKLELTRLENNLQELESKKKLQTEDLALDKEKVEHEISLLEQKRTKLVDFRTKLVAIEKDMIEAMTKSDVDKLKAIQPKLIEAIEGLGDKQVLTTLAEHLPGADNSLGFLTKGGGLQALYALLGGDSSLMTNTLKNATAVKKTQAESDELDDSKKLED